MAFLCKKLHNSNTEFALHGIVVINGGRSIDDESFIYAQQICHLSACNTHKIMYASVMKSNFILRYGEAVMVTYTVKGVLDCWNVKIVELFVAV